MASPNVSFEIQVLNDKHWVVAHFVDDEQKAKAYADNLLQKGNHSAVRVIRDFRRQDGLHSETVIQERTSTAKPSTDLGLSTITEAPPCTALADFYRPAARMTMGRLLRKYLDEVVVSPTELLHSAAEMKRFADRGTLLFSAIDRVAGLQAAAGGLDAKARRDFLAASWDEMAARARRFAARKVKPPKTVADILAEVEKGGEDHPFLCLSTMSLRLLEVRSWLGKLDLLTQWAAEAHDTPLMALIDGLVADMVVSAQLIQDLLGYQANLGAALISLCDLAEGKAEPAKFSPEIFTPLNALFAGGRLEQSAEVLVGRVVRELGGGNPLSRNEPKQEFEVFCKVAHRVVTHRGVLGGGAMADSILHRVTRIHAHLGTVTASQAIELTLSALADHALGMQYLLTLADGPLGRSMGAGLTDLVIAKIRDADRIDKWVPNRLSPPARMGALAAVNRTLRATVALPEDVRAHLGGHLDDILARYLLEAEVIEKIDKADDPLALRAIRLIKFCGSGVLIEGKSMDLARARVIEHLKQPQFEEKFLASVPEPGKAEQHLREFHRLLLQTGFR